MRGKERACHMPRYFTEWEGKTAVLFFSFSRWISVSREMADNLPHSQIQAAWEIFQSFLLQHDFFPMILFLLQPNILSPEVKIFSSGPCRDLSNYWMPRFSFFVGKHTLLAAKEKLCWKPFFKNSKNV